jgi:hypothetical protein
MSFIFFNDLERPLIGASLIPSCSYLISSLLVVDILNEEFFFSKKLFIKTKNASGMEWGIDGDLSSRGTSGTMSLSYSDPSGLTLEKLRMKVSSNCLSTRLSHSQIDGRVLGQVSYRVANDLKLVACIEDGRVEPGKPLHSFGKLGFDYSLKDKVAAQGDIDIINGPSVQGSFFCQLRFLQIGGEFMWNTHMDDKNSKPELVDLNVGGAIIGADWFTSIRTTNLFSNIRVGYTSVLSKTLNFGALVNYRVFQNQQSVLIGGLWR